MAQRIDRAASFGQNLYVDTRGAAGEPVPFTQAVINGLAQGGGLYVPEELPTLSLDEICALARLPYAQRAAAIYKAFNVDLPPLFIVTCGDDFLEADNLALAAALARKGADFELFDPKPRRHETLGHVFVIGMPWLDESVECFERLRRFSYERC